ncbi:P-loop containing nucleoside triphosphate hydrolase protein [Delphinella strobiligena]|nr:P-loop containing nucleoside triphosphate hydrolase protein [Delphinella strobiligena]
MSGRLLTSRVAPLARQSSLATRSSPYHTANRAGGLLSRSTNRPWSDLRPFSLGSNVVQNTPAVRHASFARAVPKLAMKFISVPAMFGAMAVSALAYIQYQAAQAGTYAIDLFGRARDTVSNGANSIFGGANDIYHQTRRGWEQTREGIEVPEWLQGLFAKEEGDSSGHDGPEGPGRPQKQESRAGAAAAGAATAAAFALNAEGEEDDRDFEAAARDDQMMLLTRKMIEIRSLLQTVDQADTLTLPSIVVIGSQSSGKSSVLEAIVGHEFLPKGSNMVTRRPIELTLVNTPDAHAEYGEFPALGLGKITDFAQIQKTLTDLNLAVPEADCVSDDPIQLRICSPSVPDLSLIDLPGYIQVTGFDQPTALKQKISELCDKYIQSPNIILAISAADVDLANSTALRASRRVDPRGERTIGVVTKMDLVDATRGAAILADKNYPLRLGYVGVVCKVPQQHNSLFSRGSANITSIITKNETAYFSQHPESFGPATKVTVGTPNLRKKLMHVLESTMSASLATTAEAIHHELTEATYEFKVQYNERSLSAESYLAESLDAFKHSFRAFSEDFGRAELRDILKHELDQQVLNLLAQRYWNRPIEDLSPLEGQGLVDTLAALPKATPEEAETLWRLKLDASTASLTKLGIGRLATTVVAGNLAAHIDRLIANSTFSAHPFARTAITQASNAILHDLSYDTSDELEICVKPYKHRIDLEDSEWARGRDNVTTVLKGELGDCESAMKIVEEQMGGKKKFKDVVSFIDRVRKGDIVLEGNSGGGAGGFSAALLAKGREAAFLRDRSDILRMRLLAIKSKQCASKKNKYYCPEIFLDAVAEKLTTTADLFIDAELLSKFYYQFPRTLDTRFRSLTPQQLEQFAREDPKIRRHLDVVRRKDLLEHVLKEMEALRALEQREKRNFSRGRGQLRDRDSDDRRKKSWSLF